MARADRRRQHDTAHEAADAHAHTSADVGGPNAPAAVWLPLDALTPHPRNPRVHGDEVTKLARTILRTAWGAPIVAQWRASGRHRVIAGHGRLLAAREILRGVEVDGELRGGAEHRFDPSAPGPAMLPVRVVRVSDAEADAMTLADNARGIQGVDDAALIVEMAAQFGRDAAVMADIGFDGVALDALVKSAGDAVMANGPQPPRGDGITDPVAEWQGMPEYASEDKTAHAQILVSFRSDEDVAEFLRVTGGRVAGGVNGSRTMWFPPSDERDAGRFSDREYVTDD